MLLLPAARRGVHLTTLLHMLFSKGRGTHTQQQHCAL